MTFFSSSISSGQKKMLNDHQHFSGNMLFINVDLSSFYVE